MNEKLRNPSWTREETILALDLYLKLNGEIPAASDPSIIELSDCLRSNLMMGKYRNRKNFRSASAVVLKLNNIRQAAEGGGLPHNSRMDREIWEQLGSRSAKTQEIAQTIRSAIRCFDLDLEPMKKMT
ncbi:MAG: hypothetical protein H6844_19265 [Alphaproteobacteria bacterium]|nr:hypothetical protein [Alphaproteobacteria bacterium]